MAHDREKKTKRTTLLEKLRGGDRRSVGRIAEVVTAVRKDPALFPVLFEGIFAQDEVVRMRAADAAEKITVDSPELLAPLKRRLLDAAAGSDQQEVRWHAAQMLPRLRLTTRERARAIAVLFSYLEDKSNIVRVFSMQALADFASDDAELRARVVVAIERLAAAGSPAVKSRGRKLLAKLGELKRAPPTPRRAKSQKPETASTSGLDEVFRQLRQLVQARAGFLDVQSDTNTEYILTGPMMPRWKKELWFGGVRIGRTYVSLHLMPVYMFPELLKGLSPGLRARMQGKSCFNFKRVDPELFAEVDGLLASCIERLRAAGIL
jgi:hypothetical protein